MNFVLPSVLKKLFYVVDAYGVFLASIISFIAVKTVEPDLIGFHAFVAAMSAFLALRCAYNVYFNWRTAKRT
jgi:hypothetical protein